jgi:cell division transport system permease protein
MWTNFKRVVRTGFVNFWRNGYLSFASIVVLTISLLVFGGLVFFNTLSNSYLQQVKEKVDVNVYFSLSAPESDIINLKKSLEALPEVARVEYLSREQVLENFKTRHKDDTPTLQGLDEIGQNPFPAVLNIKAKEPSQYESVAKFLESEGAQGAQGKNIVDSVNYNKNKVIIDRLGKIVVTSEKVGFALTIIFALLAIAITFNTIRLIIYASKDEIGVMKLVGASNMYVRGPFVVSGIMCGIISGIITLIIFYPITYYVGNIINNLVGVGDTGGNALLSYYFAHFGQMFLLIIGSGIILGAVSSYLAVRRHLNV